MEVALDEAVPGYSGGLGVLAGDLLRAAADVGPDMVGVTLVYRQGYLAQRLDDDGTQHEAPEAWDPAAHLEPLAESVVVVLGGEQVEVGAWRYVVRGERSEVPVVLLDTDRPSNGERWRSLTGRLYGGDGEYRLAQEAVLGLGGAVMLEALGQRVETYHLNEGHSTLVGLALLRRARHEGPGTSVEDAVGDVRRRCVFTTHTPVPAGHDRFAEDAVRHVLGEESLGDLTALGGLGAGWLDMTRLGIGSSRWTYGVSTRHAEVTRAMFPGVEVRAVTNGVHLGTWVAPAMASLFDARVPGWRQDNTRLRLLDRVPAAEVAAAHALSKEALVAEVARRTGRRLSADAFTIGAARRATAYKRMSLLFSDPGRLEKLVAEFGTLQVVLAGKAHPRDDGGKEIIRTLFRAAEQLGASLPVVFLPGYEMGLARMLVAGADVWLNTPRPPHEASGTSGMKAAANGVPNLSVLDGWWVEGYLPGVTGWAVRGRPVDESRPEAAAEADAADAAELYDVLGAEVLPLYHGDPGRFAAVRRAAVAFDGFHFTAQRMVLEYRRVAYDLDG
ncbi:MAG: alpha-glucan family phosphorylase [Acidobacteriota bacterium]|nr:alpha-glucan family phosphorylase [Acidobacteriota bacterium]